MCWTTNLYNRKQGLMNSARISLRFLVNFCVNLIDYQTWKMSASLITNYQSQNRPLSKKFRILSPLIYFLAGYEVVYIVRI
jgi:hypothetical protein